MDSDSFQLFIIAGSIVTAYCAKLWVKHRERTMELQAIARNAQGSVASDDAAALRSEIALLRDTTTQYDMSVERALQEIRHRLSALEQRSPAPAYQPSPVYSPDEAPPQAQQPVNVEIGGRAQ